MSLLKDCFELASPATGGWMFTVETIMYSTGIVKNILAHAGPAPAAT